MRLRNGKAYKDDEPDLYQGYSDINPITGGCECCDCRRIAGCVFHEGSKQGEREKKAETKARAEVMYEAEVYALEKAGGDLPYGIRFREYYLLHYRSYYESNYDNRYRKILGKISQIHMNRLMRKKPADRGFICELCYGKIW